ncbi:Na+/H+ antiporter NhaA [Psychromicrobium sp. YIM B11713]|uniref:Na+/H+ antiporter NhaA n=1 Tax=Psychromicrobium sp. YIM B11713 TaxID=3145233 RepID=UPI00374F26C8
MITSRSALRIFRRNSRSEHLRITTILRKETVGGALLLLATVAALSWANSPAAASYFSLRESTFGIDFLGLQLTVGAWASDGLLAIFFFVAGLELKREFIAGDLRRFDRAIVPIAAAVGGVVVPAVIYALVNLSAGTEILHGWAIPTATDIAFALAVLAVVGRHLPSALRTFLLTLAVVDDLIAITIIAVFYPHDLAPQYLALALIPLGLFTWLVQRRVRSWYLLLPLAVLSWALIHASGVHATVAGVLLAFAVPVLRRDRNAENGPGLAEHFEHRFRPLSTGVAVPVFAFFSAGVAVGGWPGLSAALSDSVAVGIVLALVIGKTLGILGATFLVTATTRASLDDGLAWIDVVGLAILAGIGFTVSLLISELAFGAESAHNDHAKIAILSGSLLAALLATVLLRIRNRHYRALSELESRDPGNDGVPGAFQRGQ